MVYFIEKSVNLNFGFDDVFTLSNYEDVLDFFEDHDISNYRVIKGSDISVVVALDKKGEF